MTVARDDVSFTKKLGSHFLGDGVAGAASPATRERNLGWLGVYFGLNGQGPFDGSRFEFYALADSHPDRITPADLLAVTMLSMEVRRKSRSGIRTSDALAIENRDQEIRHLLTALPADRDLHSLSDQEFESWVGPESPAERLWGLLRRDIGMHRVATFKLLARKRPRLLPISDSRVRAILGKSDNSWESWYRALVGRPDIVNELRSLRDEFARIHPPAHAVSLLRIADICLWNSASASEEAEEELDEE